jgi:hypothetical protein
MNLNTVTFNKLIKRKVATAVLIAVSLVASATLGDDGKKDLSRSNRPANLSAKTFSLRTGYNYKANTFLNSREQGKFILLNTVVTYQKGNATYVMPLKKKVLLEKIKFNPTPAPRF